jgi:hypothetical protein
MVLFRSFNHQYVQSLPCTMALCGEIQKDINGIGRQCGRGTVHRQRGSALEYFYSEREPYITNVMKLCVRECVRACVCDVARYVFNSYGLSLSYHGTAIGSVYLKHCHCSLKNLECYLLIITVLLY